MRRQRRKVERVIKKTVRKAAAETIVPVVIPKRQKVVKAVAAVLGEGLLMLSIAVFLTVIIYIYILKL